MPPELTHLTREELYALVWAEPMSTLAPRFNLSDVGLKKICQKHWIPVPGRGYWQMFQAGMRTKQPALPRIGTAPMIDIAIRPKRTRPAESSMVVEQAKTEESPENRIVVRDKLDRPHEIIGLMKSALKTMKPDDYGMLKCRDPKLFWLRVGPECLDRALRILDTLIKACAARRFLIHPQTEWWTRTGFLVNGEAVGLTLEERLRRQDHKPTPKERANFERQGWPRPPKWDFLHTGELTLKIDTRSSGVRGTWSDSSRVQIEECLNQVIMALVQVASHFAAERQREEEEERRRQVEEERLAKLKRRRETEQKAFAKLEQDAEAWQRARIIRAYADAVEANTRQKGTPSDEQTLWILWARTRAKCLDPLSESRRPFFTIPEEPSSSY